MEQTNYTETMPVNAKKIAFINGLIWAVINIFILLAVYYAMPNLLGNMAFAVVTFVISLGLAIYFVLDLRKKIGGYWSFREALSNIFIMFFVQHLVYTLFVLAFGKFIEPSYAHHMREITLNTSVEMAETFGGGNQEVIDQMIEEAEKSVEKQLNPSFSDFSLALGIAVIMYFVGALIFAAIFKRERPMFAAVREDELDEE